MKIYNGKQTRHTNRCGMDAQKKVASFIYWVLELKQSQKTIVYTFLTQSQLVLSLRDLEVEVSCVKSEPVEIGRKDLFWMGMR